MGIIDVLGNSFERILRWIYPGVLIVVLAYWGKPSLLCSVNIQGIDRIWGLVLVALVTGFVAYILQNYVLCECIGTILKKMGFPDHAEDGKNCFVTKADKNLDEAWRRFGHRRDVMNSYLNYALGQFHAALMTGWLTIVFWGISDAGSSLRNLPVLVVAILILFASLWQYMVLSRVYRRFAMPPFLDYPNSN